MPKVKAGNKCEKKYSEEQMQNAIDAVRKGMPQRMASKKFGVPRSTIQFRMSDAFVKTSRGPPPVLSQSREDDLVKWITECHKKGFPRRKENVQASVKQFLDETGIKNPFQNNTPGHAWCKSFLRRNPTLRERYAESVSRASANVTENDIRNWFSQMENFLVTNKYIHILQDPTRVFNSDETAFMVCPKLKNVIAPCGIRNVYKIDKGNSKLNLTALFTFNASGVTTPPTLVYPYKRLPSVIAKSVPEDWGIGVTQSGWMNSDLFCEYIQNIFYPHLRKEKVTFPVILFVDGHTSHINLQASNLCSKLDIIVICLYPNATRILQPADVAAFKPIKNLWKKSVLEWRQDNPTAMLTLDRMAPLLKKTIDKFSSDGQTVRNGFKACGLYPWDPNAIDYTKCLNSSEKNTENQSEHPLDEAALPFEDFVSILGVDVLQELETFSEENVTLPEKSKEFSTLQKLLHQYKKISNTIEKKQVTPSEMQESDSVQNSMEELNKKNTIGINDCDIENCNDTSNIYSHVPEELLQSQTSANQYIDLENIPLIIESDNNNIIEINDCDIKNYEINEDNATVPDEFNTNEALDLSLNHRRDCSKNFTDFLQRPPTPKRTSKKNSKRTSFAITSLQWKLDEEKKLEKQKIENKKKDARKLDIMKTKQAKEKDKENKKIAKLQKQQQNKKKKLNIKKEKIDNVENLKNERVIQNVRPTILSNELFPKKIFLAQKQLNSS